MTLLYLGGINVGCLEGSGYESSHNKYQEHESYPKGTCTHARPDTQTILLLVNGTNVHEKEGDDASAEFDGHRFLSPNSFDDESR